MKDLGLILNRIYAAAQSVGNQVVERIQGPLFKLVAQIESENASPPLESSPWRKTLISKAHDAIHYGFDGSGKTAAALSSNSTSSDGGYDAENANIGASIFGILAVLAQAAGYYSLISAARSPMQPLAVIASGALPIAANCFSTIFLGIAVYANHFPELNGIHSGHVERDRNLPSAAQCAIFVGAPLLFSWIQLGIYYRKAKQSLPQPEGNQEDYLYLTDAFELENLNDQPQRVVSERTLPHERFLARFAAQTKWLFISEAIFLPVAIIVCRLSSDAVNTETAIVGPSLATLAINIGFTARRVDQADSLLRNAVPTLT